MPNDSSADIATTNTENHLKQDWTPTRATAIRSNPGAKQPAPRGRGRRFVRFGKEGEKEGSSRDVGSKNARQIQSI
jgi:hypothetical protein